MRYTFDEWEGDRSFEKTMTVAEYDRLMKRATKDGCVRIEVESDDGTIEEVVVVRNMVKDLCGHVATPSSAAWPQVSQAMSNPGMTADERKAEQAFLDSEGVRTQYRESDNAPIFESRGHRARYMQAMGMYDRDAGYGDRAAT